MSQENVELVRRGTDAFRRRDWEAFEEIADPHISLRMDSRWPEQRAYGREAAINFYREASASGGSDLRIEDIVDLGDRVLFRLCWHMQGSQSGLTGEQRYSIISTIREGRIILEEFFLDHAEALKAVGLTE
jgi:ketosteroid isomerase-like protein